MARAIFVTDLRLSVRRTLISVVVMLYARQSNVRDDLQITAKLKLRQANNSVTVKNRSQTTFGGRLLKAFLDAKLAKNPNEIAEILRIGNSAITPWMSGDSYPKLDRLIEISEKTKCNLHWLLTGEGEAGADTLSFLPPNERGIVARLARETKRADEEVASALIIEALAFRASESFRHLYETGRLTEDERQQLIVLFDLVSDDSTAA